MEFIEGKTVTIEDNEYVGAFFNFTNNGDATTYCPNDNEMKIGFETSKLVNLQSKGIIYLLESKIRSDNSSTALLATVYKGNIIKNLIMDCQSYTKYRPNETTGGIFVSWRRKEELPTGA